MQDQTNEPASAVTHLIGAILSIAGLTLMIIFASIYATAWHVVGFSIFGASLILLYLASTLYHFIPKHKELKKTFQKIDHSMIYVLIAGTYTPVCLTSLRGGWGWSLFGIIWGLAIVGILSKSLSKKERPIVSTLFYIVMGWLMVIAFFPLVKSLPSLGLFWLVAGGVFYTIGTIFFGLDKLYKRKHYFGLHEVFHLFVMMGSFSHFWLMLRYVILV